jgi:hypothetical protein
MRPHVAEGREPYDETRQEPNDETLKNPSLHRHDEDTQQHSEGKSPSPQLSLHRHFETYRTWRQAQPIFTTGSNGNFQNSCRRVTAERRLVFSLALDDSSATHTPFASRQVTVLIFVGNWLIAPLQGAYQRDLLEDPYDNKSTMIASQLPFELWRPAISDPTLADAILDRLVHNPYRMDIQGESMRKAR